MAEKLVSPGVFTRENDLSFLQQGVAEIGAAFIGPFLEGPVVPTIVNSQAEFAELFGAADGTYYTPLAVQNYLREAGTATICRVAGVGGYTETAPLLLTATSGAVSQSLGILFNTSASANAGFAGEGITDTDGNGDFTLSTLGAASLNVSDTNNIESVFGNSPFGTKEAYVYGFFKNSNITFDTQASASVTVLGNQKFSGSYGTGDACEALTPMIKSQTISGDRFDLFQFETLGVGNSANTKVKIGISNIKPAGTINGTDYGTFTVVVRDFNDTEKKKVVLETYSNVNLDPNSANFISRVIGDRRLSINSLGKITEIGDWVNNSKYVRVANLNINAPVQAVPFGHSAYTLPVSASAGVGSLIPRVTFGTGSIDQSGSLYYAGIDLDFNTDNSIYLKPIPTGAGVGSNSVFGLDSLTSTTSALTNLVVGDARAQFIVAFQEGFDGMNPATVSNLGSNITMGNSQGFDLTNSTSKGSLAYMKAINALSNADEFDINMIIAPGVVQRVHSYISNAIIDLCEQRSDCFYIMDGTTAGDTIKQATDNANLVDTNYAASYYPWIKTIDVNTNKLITVPPSVLLPGVFAANDRVAAEWFAPAGLNRGGLVGAVSVLNRLTQSEKDELYEGKVNPIVQFPGQGIVVFGQKTLQDKPSALDRINVRRLLLTVRKYIASTSRYLVFEQNTSETRNRFLNIVNPYLESIQQRQGLYAFRVVMDDSNNTPDVIDRNIMKGAIYLQPTKTAEFIQIDFNILPTGAAFNG
jgi:phage tail sheath protein FI